MTALPDTACSRLSSPEVGLETEFGVSGLTTCEEEREEDWGEEEVNPRCRPTKDLATLAGNSRMSLPITVPCQAETGQAFIHHHPSPSVIRLPWKGGDLSWGGFLQMGQPLKEPKAGWLVADHTPCSWAANPGREARAVRLHDRHVVLSFLCFIFQ